VPSACKSQITLDEEISLPELHLPSLVWLQNIAHWKPGVVIPAFCFLNFIKTHILSGAGKSIKVTNVFILYRSRKYCSLIWGLYRNTQGVLHECLVVPTQWNCYHLSCEQKLSGTAGIVANHEALGKDIHFCKDSLGYKRVHLFLMELNTHSATQGWLKVTSRLELTF
jgi:hypothetical protein